MNLETTDKVYAKYHTNQIDLTVILQLFKMIQYVEQEGYEKADEIDAKAEDEFNMEKKKLLKEASIKIDIEYEKKRKTCKKRHIMYT